MFVIFPLSKIFFKHRQIKINPKTTTNFESAYRSCLGLASLAQCDVTECSVSSATRSVVYSKQICVFRHNHNFIRVSSSTPTRQPALVDSGDILLYLLQCV